MPECLAVDCHREATVTTSRRPNPEPALCEVHAWYFLEVLADPHYINHEPPKLMSDGSLQLRLGGVDISIY